MEMLSGMFGRMVLLVVCYVSLTECLHRRLQYPSRSMTVMASETGSEMLVNVLRSRGDNLADTNAHRIILSVDTASNFINDVLDSAITKTFHSAVSSRENLFFSLQRVGNDSRRIFELLDRATTIVSDTAKKAKTEVNDAIKTSLDHLRESMKIIIRNVPESKLTETNLAAIISNGQYRMEVVVENSGQRIIDAIQSYRSHFITIDKDTGNIMVDPESSQEATEAVKHIISAAKSQIQEAVSGSTSFILSRIRDGLSSSLNDESSSPGNNATNSPSLTITVSINGSSDTFQAEVISMEDPQEDKIVVIGDIPDRESNQSTSTTPWESPMIINTRWTTSSPDGTTTTNPNNDLINATVAPSTTRLVSWQDDIAKASFSATVEANSNSGLETSTANSWTMEGAGRLNLTASGLEIVSTTTVFITNSSNIAQGPLIRRRIPQIKPILSTKGSS